MFEIPLVLVVVVGVFFSVPWLFLTVLGIMTVFDALSTHSIQLTDRSKED